MVVKRFYNDKLAQASYLVGCNATGEAVVIDPNRDIDQYIAAAQAEGLRVTAVTETHIHADYLSGSRELAKKTGATLYLSDEGGVDWKYAFGTEATLIKDGSHIQIGNVRLDVVHTPGHTPEHISFLLTDEPASPRPMGAFTGDFVFVGDVGRPDLLERAANIKGTMEVGGRQLFASLQKFATNQDGLLIWPGHGAGSACGKSLGGVPVTSLGYEKVSNWAFQAKSEESFVREVLAGQPEPPPYFAMMKKLNKEGPAIHGAFVVPARIDFEKLSRLIDEGAQVIDIRSHKETKAGFLPGALLIPGDKSFVKWAGWLVAYDSPIYIIANDEQQALAAVKDLAMIGLDDVQGWIPADELQNTVSIKTIRGRDLADWRGSVLDVRWADEYAEGHVSGAVSAPLGYLRNGVKEAAFPDELALYCGTGNRSQIALGVLARQGFTNLCNVEGGYDEYIGMGGSVEACSAPG